MSKSVHIQKKADGGWAVKRQGAGHDASLHKTQAEAVAAGRRLALKSGGAEVVIHRADGRIRDRDTVGAAQIDAAKQDRAKTESRTKSSREGGRPSAAKGQLARSQGQPRKVAATSRAPRSEGPRTTLRVPHSLAEIADRLAQELEVSRNDALLRLATRGARQYEQEQRIADLRDDRWAAVVPGLVDIEHTEFPPVEDARDAVLAARDEAIESAS